MTTDQSKSWLLSFEIKPIGIEYGWNNIVHFNSLPTDDYYKYGSRMPAIWFISGTTQLHMRFSANKVLPMYNHDKNLTQNEFTHIQLIQRPNDQGKYMLSVYIGGVKVYGIENKDARSWNNVDAYVSSPLFRPAKAYVRNFVYKNFAGGKPLISLHSCYKSYRRSCKFA